MSACSGSTASYTSDSERGTTHALITVERRESLNDGVSDAKAFATVVRTPPEVDISQVTRLTGLDLTLPELGECALGGTHREPSATSSPLRRVDLLAAGDVALETPIGSSRFQRRARSPRSPISSPASCTRRAIAALSCRQVKSTRSAQPAGQPRSRPCPSARRRRPRSRGNARRAAAQAAT
ncbi:MAG: hypothetical protein QM756_00920 [Polyangiaceae bacterium]